jgi:putative NADPH-quinone reductase
MVLLIHAHPDPESFTLALAEAVKASMTEAGQEVISVDLYRLNGGPHAFQPVLDLEELRRKSSLEDEVQKQMSLVEKAEGYVVIHPDWWGGPPAVLKGWVDRVLRPGTAYEFSEAAGNADSAGLLHGKKALVAVTGDARSAGPLEEFWVDRVWGFCGVKAHFRYMKEIGKSSRKQRQQFIDEVLEATGEITRRDNPLSA